MSNNILINSICVKLIFLLASDKKYPFRYADLLYHLAISDFYCSDRKFASTSIRNINSILYYSKNLNQALFKMQSYNLLIIDGELYKSSYLADCILCQCSDKNSSLYKVKEKMVETHNLCVQSKNVVQTYNELYEKYLKNKVDGGV